MSGQSFPSTRLLLLLRFSFCLADAAREPFVQHRGVQRLKKHLNFTNTCGYITFLKTGVKDIGSEEDAVDVKLQRPQRRKSSAVGATKRRESNIPKDPAAEILSPNDDMDISTFQKKFAADEEHFKGPGSGSGGSPANEYRSADCNELLESELDTLTGEEADRKALVSQASIEVPIGGGGEERDVEAGDVYDGEEWTILEVQFGVPLFDFDCNTRICQNLASKLLTEEK